MKTNRFKNACAFTLVEMLVVITIILILAAILLNVSGYVNNKAARSRAEGEIRAISTALESYKADTGDYPSVLVSSASPEANKDGTIPPLGGRESRGALYEALTGDGDSLLGGIHNALGQRTYWGEGGVANGPALKTIYVDSFKQNQIGSYGKNNPQSPPPPPGQSYPQLYAYVFNDPWGRSYIYDYPGYYLPGQPYDLGSDTGNAPAVSGTLPNPSWIIK
jgi:prepilin-type N-terminal cleavage/methylation domain-containing protein